MAKYNGNVSFGFDAFDRAYEPEVVAYCNELSGDISSLACSVNGIAATTDALSSCVQGTSNSAYTYNDSGVSLCINNDGVIFTKAINTVADSAVGVSNNFDKLSKAIRKIAEMTGLEMDSDLNIIENNGGYGKTARSYKSKLGGVSKLSRSQLLTI